MYSNLNLYYLKQMGIVPWITKDAVPKVLPDSSIAKSKKFKIIVFISLQPNGKALSLFKSMIVFLRIPNDDFLLVTINPEQPQEFKTEAWFLQVENQSPLAILALGPNVIDLMAQANIKCPVIHSLPLEQMLAQPLSKKKLYKEISSIQHLFE